MTVFDDHKILPSVPTPDGVEGHLSEPTACIERQVDAVLQAVAIPVPGDVSLIAVFAPIVDC